MGDPLPIGVNSGRSAAMRPFFPASPLIPEVYMAETGQRVGDYEVLAQLGAGGMGRLFKVRNIISNREEAMKILLPDFASDPDLSARFMAESRKPSGQ